MFDRLRRLEISLAAKCQILFGAAVVLIIAAALAVPWHRMEQLTQQLDERAADALVADALSRHIAVHSADGDPAPRTPPPLLPTTTGSRPDDAADSIPRLLARGTSEPTTLFERRTLAGFMRRPDNGSVARYYEREDGTSSYRFAQPLFLTEQCAACHTLDGDRFRTTTSPAFAKPAMASASTTRPTSAAATQPSGSSRPRRPFVGIVSIDMPSRIDPNQLLLNRFFILAAGLLAGTLAIVAFYLITTRLILQPVRVLRETAERVSEGDLNVRSDINTGDEFQQLSDTFNIMLSNLKMGADQLRSINKSLDLKLGQLAESNLALYESNRLKSEFLANVSHELRTPLNSILGFADLLKDNLAGGIDAKPARYVNNILHSSKHLLDLINDLLDLAKIEAGRMEIRSEPLSLPDVFEGLENLLRPLWEGKGLLMSAVADPAIPVIHTDPAKLQQVLYNFLSNAIKFSPPGGHIELTAVLIEDHDNDRDGSGERGAVRIAVKDNGHGIEPDKQELIFEKFRQVDASVTRTHSGTGLGLAIAKELTSLLGGTIGVESDKGKGATFWIVLPLRIQAGEMDVRGRLVWS